MTDEILPPDVISGLAELSEHFTEFEQHHRGANGYLFFAKNKVTDLPVAIKFYAGESGEARHEEPKQLSAVRSPNVLPILDAQNVSDDWGYFVTTRCFEGDLDDLIAETPSAHSAVDVSLGICNGLSAIHALRLLHRDLKPGNIVLLNGAPQIADFGSLRALAVGSSNVTASQHSVLFRPPESFQSGQYSVKGDIYQVGLITYQLLGGSLPYDGTEYFNNRDKLEFLKQTSHADRSIFINKVIQDRAERGTLVNFGSLPAWVTGSAKRLLKVLINIDPDVRPTNVGDVAALLTQMRASMLNWRWHGDIAVLAGAGRSIELRPTDGVSDSFQAYLSKDGGAFRKIPRVPVSPLAGLIANLS